MTHEERIEFIMEALRGMLKELNKGEVDMEEDFIVNFCYDCYVDESNQYPNLFRMLITENSNGN